MINNFVNYVVAPAWAAWERSPYLRHHRRLRRTQFDSPEAIRRRQEERMRGLVAHASRTTEFYRKRFADAGLRAESIDSLDAFRAVPLLTKTDLRESGPQLRSTDCPTRQLHRKKTSGSTGVSVEVVVDDAAQQFKRACTLRSDQWSGWRLGERVAALWGADENPRKGIRAWLRNALLERMILLDTLKITEESMSLFAAALRKYKPTLLFGHAHSLYLFAQFLSSRKDVGVRPKGIISTAMVLHEFERRKIEDVFDCPVTNRYGCEEVSLIACECERHEGLHVNADGLYLEIIRPDGSPCMPGEPGMVVVTDLVNYAMPILRYQIGDMATWSSKPCSCGRGLPLLAQIEGRIADYVVTPRGTLVSGISLTDHFNTKIPGIAQLQIVQETVDHFLFRIVKDNEFAEAGFHKLRSLVAEHFGLEAQYECEFVEQIPKEPSGKFRFCISKVNKNFVFDR